MVLRFGPSLDFNHPRLNYSKVATLIGSDVLTVTNFLKKTARNNGAKDDAIAG